MRTVGVEEVLKVAEEVVSGKEDFVYNPNGAKVCHYLPMGDSVIEGDPRKNSGCIVGEIMIKFDVPVGFLDFEGNAYNLLKELEEEKVISFTPDASFLLRRMQHKQDHGDSWGDSLLFAKEYSLDCGWIKS